MKCAEANRLLSPYLDGAVSGTEMQALQEHLEACAACFGEYRLLRQTQQLLMSVGRPKEPADLGLKLRLAISREAAETRRPRYEGLRVRLENSLERIHGAGYRGTGLRHPDLSAWWPRSWRSQDSLQANNTEDVPLMLNTGPELQQSAFGTMSSRSTPNRS
jgi:hypothetical protein